MLLGGPTVLFIINIAKEQCRTDSGRKSGIGTAFVSSAQRYLASYTLWTRAEGYWHLTESNIIVSGPASAALKQRQELKTVLQSAAQHHHSHSLTHRATVSGTAPPLSLTHSCYSQRNSTTTHSPCYSQRNSTATHRFSHRNSTATHSLTQN